MACTVTKYDIQRELKARILNKFDTAKPIDNGLSVFIAINSGNANFLGSQVSSTVSALNNEFGAQQYGNVLTSSWQEDFGYTIEINPSQLLADAMTQQNIVDEVGEDYYMGDEALREQEYYSPRNAKRPITDNYKEYLVYKETQLSKVREVLKNLSRDRKNPKKDLSATMAQINKFTNIEAGLKNDIANLRTNEVNLLFHGLSSEIQDLSKSLDLADNVESIRDRIDFLYRFIKGVSLDNREESNIESIENFNHPDFTKVSTDLDALNRKYIARVRELTGELIKTDISFANNVLNNSSVSADEIANMFNNKNDINWMEKTFLGITSSGTDDTLLPQVLKSFLETKVALRDAEAKVLQDRLTSLVNKLEGDNFDFIFEKTAQGTKTGNIINLYTPEFSKVLNNYLSIDSQELLDEDEKYEEKIKWLRKNTTVIDPRKLRFVQEAYGDVYPEHFTYSEQEMDMYDTFLKRTLGALYEEEMDKLMNYLENFQIQKETLLQDITNPYRFRNVAKVDPWAFAAHYNSPHAMDKLPYNSGGVNTETVYSDVQNIKFIPIKNQFITFDTEGNDVTRDSGFYNKNFEMQIQPNPDRLAYWNLMKEIYTDHINPTYSTRQNSLSYAKFEKEFLETLAEAKGLQKGSAIYNKAKSEFKGFFYERGYDITKKGVKKDYSDQTYKDISSLRKILIQKGLPAVQLLASQEGINYTGLSLEDLSREVATRQIIDNYSTDINKATSALLHMSAVIKAKEDTLPIARVILDSHKLIRNDKGEDRKRSVERMENWINRVVKNENEKYRGSTNFLGQDLTKKSLFGSILDKLGQIPFIKNYVNKKRANFLTDSEKQIMQHLEDLRTSGHNKTTNSTFVSGTDTYSIQQTSTGAKYYRVTENKPYTITEQQFEEKFQENIEAKIEELGLDLNAAGVIQGVLKMIILKGLGLNPISGIFNRVEGKNSGLVMDKTGKYWTKGNIHGANNFLAFANFINFLPERLQPAQLNKVKELQKLQIFLQNVSLIQDRKNELERQTGQSKFDYEKWTNIYQFAVDNPEFKNQGAILLSVLMDTKIQDTAGNEVAIFDGSGFPAYDNVDGKLVLKEQFRSPRNISNWENFDIDETDATNNQYFLTKQRIKAAISRSQGNYDNLDVIDATKHIWGRALTMFMKWMPEHFMQRFSSGKGFDITTGEEKLKGRYRYLWNNNPALLTTGALTLFTGLGLTPVSAIAGLGLTGIIAGKYFYELYGKDQINRDANNTLEFIAFTKSVVVNTLNYPLEFFNSNKLLKEEFGDNIIPGYNKTNLSQEEINNLQAIAKELGIKLSFIAFLLLVKKLTWDDDDEKDSEKRQFHNFMDNQLNRMISSISNWTNPESLASDAQRLAFLQYLWDAGKLMKSIITMNEDGKLQDNAFKSSPLPRMLYKPTSPWRDEKEYDKGVSWEDKLIKNINSGGDLEAGKTLKELKASKKEEFKEQFSKQYEGDQLNEAVRKAMQAEFPKKKEGENNLSLLMRIEAGEKGKVPKKSKAKKASRQDRNTFKDNLKAQGLTNEEIYEKMREEFKSR